jgi:hypothetical protein
MKKGTKVGIGFAALVSALIVLAVPGFIRARTVKATNACLNNLRQIDGAKQQWALENDKTDNETASWDGILPYLGRGTNIGPKPSCPDGGTYILGRVGETPRCSCGSRLSE